MTSSVRLVGAPSNPKETNVSDLRDLAVEITERLREHFPDTDLKQQQVLCLAEEAGEFVGAYRRWAGMARRSGPWGDVEAELADVVVTAYVTAQVLGIDLDAAVGEKTKVVFTRGWRDKPAEVSQ